MFSSYVLQSLLGSLSSLPPPPPPQIKTSIKKSLFQSYTIFLLIQPASNTAPWISGLTSLVFSYLVLRCFHILLVGPILVPLRMAHWPCAQTVQLSCSSSIDWISCSVACCINIDVHPPTFACAAGKARNLPQSMDWFSDATALSKSSKGQALALVPVTVQHYLLLQVSCSHWLQSRTQSCWHLLELSHWS